MARRPTLPATNGGLAEPLLRLEGVDAAWWVVPDVVIQDYQPDPPPPARSRTLMQSSDGFLTPSSFGS